MEIKTWHKVAFFGSITALIIYIKRNYLADSLKKGLSKFELGQRLIAEYATKWVGTTEVGNNNGWANDMFQAMMREVGWSNNEQWCMYFAKMVHYNTFPKDRANINRVLNGRTQESFNNAMNDTTGTYKVVYEKPQVGDIQIFQRRNSPSTGHAGVVVKVNNDNTVDTVEGNTSDRSISSGELVAKKKRTAIVGNSIGDNLIVRGFIRKVNMLT